MFHSTPTSPRALLNLLVWLALLVSVNISAACARAAAPGAFKPVQNAAVEMKNGVPRLLINGKPVLPLIFHPNTDIPGEFSARSMREQVKLASEAGVRIYNFPYRVHRSEDGLTADYSTQADNIMQTIIDIDPHAVFVLRMFPGPWPFWKEWSEIPSDHITKFADGTNSFISINSEYFWELSNKRLIEDIRHLESGPLGDRVICYQLGGPEIEMFTDSYREKGPDYSGANLRRFRLWLRDMYKSDAALQQALGRPEITLETAGIPTFEPGRFPMHRAPKHVSIKMFYRLPEEQDWVDYGFYCSDIASDRILDWAKLVKKETGGRKLTSFFYGYTFELCGSFSGHCRLDKVLACPEVDILGSPYPYLARKGGDPSGYMSPVDSITAHGKLWCNEDDTITSLVDFEKTIWYTGVFHASRANDFDETIGILERNFGAILAHRAGTWWDDLAGAGAFNHPALWQIMKERSALMADVHANPSPYRPEVAVIIDEVSKSVVKSDWDATFYLLMNFRNEMMKSGAVVGFYTLDDFVSGIVPKCKAYAFPNAFVMTDEQVRRVHERLDREKSTAIWVYAPGCFGPQGFDAGLVDRIAGIKVKAVSGRQGSTGVGRLAEQRWGHDAPVEPRLSVDDPGAEALGIYRSDHAASAARKRVGKHTSVFVGDISVTSSLLRSLIDDAGGHIWTRDDSVIQTDGKYFMVHTGTAGQTTVHLPEGVKAEIISGTKARFADRAGNTLTLSMKENDTAWLRLRGN